LRLDHWHTNARTQGTGPKTAWVPPSYAHPVLHKATVARYVWDHVPMLKGGAPESKFEEL